MTAPHLSLEEISSSGLFSDGDWIESKDQDPSGSVRLTQLADIGIGTFLDKSSRYLRPDQAESLNCTYLQPNDILIARMPEPLGRACLVPGNIGTAVTVVDVAILRVDQKIALPHYVMWMINSPQFSQKVAARQSGTTRKRISRRNVSTLTIPVPHLEEQRRIVDAIETYIERLNRGLERFAHASTLADSQLRSALWLATHNESERVLLKDIAEVKLGRQRSPKNHSGDRMIPYLRAANVDWNRLRLDDVKAMNFTEAEQKTFELRSDDILLTEASGSPAEVGKSVLYAGEPAGVCFQNTLLRVRCTDANARFVQKYLLAEAMAGQFRGDSRGVGIRHLGRSRLANWPISLPAPQQQERAADQAEKAINVHERIQAQVTNAVVRTKSLRRSILYAAFEGRLAGSRSSLTHATHVFDNFTLIPEAALT